TATEREYERVQQENEKFYELRTEALRLLSLYRPLLPAVLGLITGVLIYYGGLSFSLGGISYGRFVGFVTLIGMLYLPARFLSWGVGMYQRASASGERTFYILDHEDELTEPEDPVRVEDIDGKVEFDGVDFSYRGDNWILRDINLTVEPGQTVALLGGTGSGKTSLVNLIPRFYDVDTRSTVTYKCKKYPIDNNGKVEIEGETYTVEGDTIEIEGEEYPVKLPGAVRVDGIDVRLYSLEDLRSNIGMVHQDPFLFSASVRDNIAFGDPQASFEDIKEAAKAANIHDYIITLENGYDARIGERGVTLSGGQKQRISIARALLANPRILILDDSTSSVDARTEMLIQEALEKLMTGRTTFIITHRLSTIRNADKIVMMDRGRIVEKGTHKELLKEDGLYAGLHATLKDMEIAAPQTDTTQSSAKKMEVSSGG
ncbi:MAG: ABC transporter ATP-binding protein, partial [Promethearchaeia archaeon]